MFEWFRRREVLSSNREELSKIAFFDQLFTTALYRSILTRDCVVRREPSTTEHTTWHLVFAQPPGTPIGKCFMVIANIEATGGIRDRSLLLLPEQWNGGDSNERAVLAMRIYNTGYNFEWCTLPAGNGDARSTSANDEQEQAMDSFKPLCDYIEGISLPKDNENEHADHLRDMLVLYQAFLGSNGVSVRESDRFLGQMRAAMVKIIGGLPE